MDNVSKLAMALEEKIKTGYSAQFELPKKQFIDKYQIDADRWDCIQEIINRYELKSKKVALMGGGELGQERAFLDHCNVLAIDIDEYGTLENGFHELCKIDYSGDKFTYVVGNALDSKNYLGTDFEAAFSSNFSPDIYPRLQASIKYFGFPGELQSLDCDAWPFGTPPIHGDTFKTVSEILKPGGLFFSLIYVGGYDIMQSRIYATDADIFARKHGLRLLELYARIESPGIHLLVFQKLKKDDSKITRNYTKPIKNIHDRGVGKKAARRLYHADDDALGGSAEWDKTCKNRIQYYIKPPNAAAAPKSFLNKKHRLMKQIYLGAAPLSYMRASLGKMESIHFLLPDNESHEPYEKDVYFRIKNTSVYITSQVEKISKNTLVTFDQVPEVDELVISLMQGNKLSKSDETVKMLYHYLDADIVQINPRGLYADSEDVMQERLAPLKKHGTSNINFAVKKGLIESIYFSK